MLRISRGTLSPALNTPLARNWRPLAALTAGLVVGVFVGFSLVGSRTATSAQPEPAAVNPPVVGDTTDAVGIPYQGTGPAAEIIRGSYRDEPAAPKAPVVLTRPPALAFRIRAPGRRPTSSAVGPPARPSASPSRIRAPAFRIRAPGRRPRSSVARTAMSLPRRRHRSCLTRPPALASRTRAPGLRPTSSAVAATPPAADASRALRPGDRRTASPACMRGLLLPSPRTTAFRHRTLGEVTAVQAPYPKSDSEIGMCSGMGVTSCAVRNRIARGTGP